MEEWLQLFLSDVPLTPDMGQELGDEEALRIAIREAYRGYGFTSPNPAVGCVILDSKNRFLASGYHEKAGEAHAEINALAGLATQPLERDNHTWDLSHIPVDQLKGARVFVTLEPCAHSGKTPSCAQTLMKLPLKEVIVILKDPFEQVNGKGFELLQQAGIKTRCLEDEGSAHEHLIEAARAVCEFFLVNAQEKRCFVSLKVATSLDGMMALKNGESQWITSDSTRTFARFLRGAHESCLVGKNTILKDNPKLDARETPFQDMRRTIVILDSQGEVLEHKDLEIFKIHAPENIIVCVGPDAKHVSSSKAQVLQLKRDETLLKSVLDQLWEREVRSVWIEGGAKTLSEALAAGIGDRLWLFQGPHLLGGAHGRPWTESWGISQMQHRRSLAAVRHLSLGSDHLTVGRMTNPKT